jgi:hypothetical protein
MRLGIAGVALSLVLLPSMVLPVGAATTWPLEFGPYAGHFGFDRLTRFEDHALFGARLGVRARRWLVVEGGFDEVYTSRAISGNQARQVSLNLRARVEPIDWAVRPYLLVGEAAVFLDDSEDPDAWGDALDLGAGFTYGVDARWILRAEWVLRRQGMELLGNEVDEDGYAIETAEILWGRSFTLGVSRVF